MPLIMFIEVNCIPSDLVRPHHVRNCIIHEKYFVGTQLAYEGHRFQVTLFIWFSGKVVDGIVNIDNSIENML